MTALFSRQHPRLLVSLIAVATVIPLGALLWLGRTLLEQGRELEKQQADQQLARAADRVTGALERSLAESERRLATGERDWPDGAVVLAFSETAVDVLPRGRLAYLPLTPPLREPDADTFRAAEALEYRQRRPDDAIAAYRDLAQSHDPAVRAAAQLRLAQALTRAGRSDDALAAYEVAAGADGFALAHHPTSLLARFGRCQLLEDTHRSADLAADAASLAKDLDAGRWALSETLYALYSRDAERWIGTRAGSPHPRDRLLETAAARLWKEWQSGQRTWRPRWTMDVDGRPVTVLSPSSQGPRRVLVASHEFAQSEWIRPLAPLAHDEAVTVAIHDATGKPLFETGSTPSGEMAVAAEASIERRTDQGSLPWSIVVTTTAPPIAAAGFAQSRRLLILGFGIIVVLSILASYLTARAVGHELAVARLQSDFVAAVSHEFRTPLTTLRQFTERLHDRPGMSDSDRLECYERQLRATSRLTRLVESLLDFGRMQVGAHTFLLQPNDVTNLVSRVVEDFRAQPHAAGYDIAFDHPGPVTLAADCEALSLAVWNLLDNAVKYSPDHREVRVRLEVSDGRASISVRDRGLGIPQSEVRHVFQQFRRGAAARDRGIAGTGIGLALVDRIVTAHGGRVHVQSKPGAGRTFTISLPAVMNASRNHEWSHVANPDC